MKLIKVAPSILSADFADLGSEVRSVEAAGADIIHVDVMDGHFVPNITIGPIVVKAIRKISNLPFDVHLMINNPDLYIDDFANAGADYITVHAEAVTHLDRTIKLIKSKNVKAGVSLVPSTHPSALDYVLDQLDLILIMSVNPGFGGQSFLSSQLSKIESIRKSLDVIGSKALLAVDGGINDITAKQVVAAGADTLIAGSFIFASGSSNYSVQIAKLKR